MKSLSIGKVLAGVAGLAVIGLVAAGLSGVFNGQFTDGGLDVRNTACEEIAATRGAVLTERDSRKAAAQETFDAQKDQISDEYWAKNQQLEREYHECISRALTADPCKEAFEEIGRLYEEIMADFAADKGFNEAKFNEREEAKKEYNDCVAETHKPEFYKDKEAQCEANLQAGKEANLKVREAADAAAQARYAEAIVEAESSHGEKQAVIDAIEKKCKEPGKTTNIIVG